MASCGRLLLVPRKKPPDDARVGNRTQVMIGAATTSYTPNALNQYATVNTVTYTYDAQGNLTYDGGSHLQYDAENRLTQAEVFIKGTTVTYAYDPLGRQLSRTQAGQPIYFLSDRPRLEDVDDMGPMQSHHQRVHRGLACAR